MPTEKEVKNILAEAAMGNGTECGCEVCRERRENNAALGAFQLLYPELPFVPNECSGKFNAGKLPRHFTYYILHTQSVNKLITKKEQLKDNPKPLHFCRQCGELVLAKNSKPIDDHRYCKRCLSNISFCQHCNEVYLKRDCYTGYGSGGTFHVCVNCRKHYIKCNNCNTLLLHKDAIKIKDRRDDRGNMQYKYLCSQCVKETQLKCSRCGGITYTSSCTSRMGHAYCNSCSEESVGIANHNYKPLTPRFRKSKREGKVTRKAFHMGFELEVAEHHSLITHDNVVQMVKEYVGRKNIYAMSDGSISAASGTNGAEFASHPFTWQYYKERGYIHWDKLCLKLREFGWRGNTPGLGIHIHTTKAAWGTHQIYKLLRFVSDNKTFVQIIAQRGPTLYNNYEYMEHSSIGQVAKDKKQNGGHGHYQCINLNQGETGLASKTIEFRMFQSTLEPLYFHKNIEFVYSLWKFTQEHSLQQMEKPYFVAWLMKHKRDYPCLIEFLKKVKTKGVN